MRILVVFALAFSLEGCDQLAKPKSLPQNIAPVQQPSCSVSERFEKTEVFPITLRADIMLDRCTGQICRTWNWVTNSPTGVVAEYQNAPLCKDLTDPTKSLAGSILVVPHPDDIIDHKRFSGGDPNDSSNWQSLQ